LRHEPLEDRRLLSVVPNDPLFSDQWALENTGQTGGTWDADIDAPGAWSVSTGNTATVVAVLDTGIDYTHEDLYLNIWLNQGEIPTGLAASLADTDGDALITFRDLNDATNASYVSDLNGTGYIDAGDLLADPAWTDLTDGDVNGYADDLVGWDWVNNDNDPMDENSHGTAVSGLLGATGDNGVGIAGVSWSVQMMPLRFKFDNPTWTVDAAVSAIDYAVDQEAPISNNSWGNGTGEYIPAIYDAIDRARLAGHIFVAAAGNESRDADSMPRYPACYDLDNIISVGGTNRDDVMASFSNWGATSVDLVAPTSGVMTTYRFNQYGLGSGTSSSTPHVAGVAALLHDLHPDWTYTQVIDQILSTGDPSPSLQGKTVSGGRLNAAAALDLDVTTYQSTDTPKDLKDGKNAARPGVVTSTIEITGPGTVIDLNVKVDITHTYDSDLTATLFAPDGTPVELFSNVGGSGDHFTGTVLDDAAGTPITAGSAPFTGAFHPEGSLVAFNDMDAAGTWTLEISDNARGDSGTLNSWSIDIATYLPEPNDPPVAVDDSATTSEDTAVVIAVLSNDYDLDGDSIYVDSVTDGEDGSVTINPDDTVTYTPNADFNGIDTFTYTVADGKGGSTTGTVTVTVDPVADSPVAVDDTDSTSVDTAVVIDVLANDDDPDGDTLSVVSVGSATDGTVIDNGDGTVTYTPDPGTSGLDSFTYTITDGDPGTPDATATVSVDVQSIPSELEFSSTGDPRNIGDLKIVSSPIVVSGTGVTVADLTVRINLSHANPSDLTAQLISSTGSTLSIGGPIVAGDYLHEYVVSGATNLPLDGTWTLQVTDNVKNRKRGSLIEWTMTVTPESAAASSQSAAATDMAMAAWAAPNSSDDDDTAPLTTQAADELALMLLA